jgi:hypothetical protein
MRGWALVSSGPAVICFRPVKHFCDSRPFIRVCLAINMNLVIYLNKLPKLPWSPACRHITAVWTREGDWRRLCNTAILEASNQLALDCIHNCGIIQKQVAINSEVESKVPPEIWI